MEQELRCPICQGNKSEIVGKDVKLSGKIENKEFLTVPLVVLQCIRCGYNMFFDKRVQLTTKS